MNQPGPPLPSPSRARRRRVAVAAALVLAGTAALIALAPSMIDTEPMRERVVADASRALGHPVRVAGAVRLTLLPRPALVLEDVQVRESEDDGSAELMAARRVRVEPALGALLRGEVQLDALRIENAQAWLRLDAAGRPRWTLDAGAGAAPRSIEGRDVALHVADGDREVTLALARFDADLGADGTLAGEARGQISGLDAQVAPQALLDAVGARGDGLAVDARFTVGPGPVLALPSLSLGDGSERVSGTLRIDWPRRRLEAELSRSALALSDACPVPSGEPAGALSHALPPTDLGGWSAVLDLRVETLRAAGVDLRGLHASASAGDGRVALSAAAGDDTLEVALERGAADGTAARLTLRAAPATASAVLACLGVPAPALANVRGLDVALESSGGSALALLDGATGHVRIAGVPVDGAAPWALLDAHAELAAGRLASAELRLAHGPGEPLVLSASGGPLRELLRGEWPFDAKWTVAGRQHALEGSVVTTGDARRAHGSFRAGTATDPRGAAMLSGTGRWTLQGERVALSALAVEVAGNALAGELAFDASVSPIAVTGHLRLDTAGVDWLASLAPGGAPAGTELPEFAIEGLRVQIGSLDGLPFAMRAVDARLVTRGDELRFDPLAVDMLAARWRGEISVDATGDPPGARYALTVEEAPLADVPVFAALPVRLDSAQGVKVAGRWSGRDAATVAASLELDASGDRLSLQAPPALGGGELVLEQVTARLRPRDGLAVHGLATLHGEALEVDVAAAPRDPAADWRVKASARGAVGELRIAGDVGGDVAGEAAVDVSAEGPDLARLLALVGVDGPHVSGEWSANARVTRDGDGDGDAVALAPLAVSAGAIGSLSGDARLEHAERPRLTARLTSQRVDLSGLVAAAEPPVATDGRHIPNTHLPVPPDPGLDSDISVEIAEVLGLPERLRDVRARLRSDATRAALDDVHATMADGAVLTGRVATEAADPARRWSVAIDARGVDMGVFITYGDDVEPIGWPADATLGVDGTGDDLYALLASARGTLQVRGGRTTLGKEDFSVWDVNLLNMMLPAIGDGRPSRMNCASIEAEIGGGRLTTEALIIDAENVTIAGSGSVDLRSEALDVMLVPSPKHPGLLGGATPVHVTGTVAAPQVSVASGALVTSSGALLLGALNPYLLLGAMVPASAGDSEATCGRAVELAEQPSAEVARKAGELEKAHGGGVTRVLTAPLRAIGGALRGRTSGAAPQAPVREE